MLVGDEIPLTNGSTLRLGSFNDGCAYNKLPCRIIASDITTKEEAKNFVTFIFYLPSFLFSFILKFPLTRFHLLIILFSIVLPNQ
jgi:hypothetical protein